ncbi:MAG: hypothetical protein M1816_005163 [Peltula sp. TS41687]|nr:MAG: hypothetical protein M1816_005163 [Peltula sp. TS41687]
MSQERTNRSDIESPVTARLPAELVDLAFSIAAFQQSGHQHAQIIERNSKHVIQAITSQYPAPERFQERQRRSTRQNTSKTFPGQQIGPQTNELLDRASTSSLPNTAGSSRHMQQRNPTAEKESTTVDKDDRRVNRSPTIELPQHIPRITPESERNQTARLDEPARPPGTNTNVNMTLSLEDLQ